MRGKMFNATHPHFVTGNFTPQNVFLGDQEYGLALDCLVKACTDLLILDSDDSDCKVLLGKRIVEPQPDWWYDSLAHLCIIDLWVFRFNIAFRNAGYVEAINTHSAQETKYVDLRIVNRLLLFRVLLLWLFIRFLQTLMCRYVGGRMKPGENPEQSIARLVKRELHLLVEPSRFRPLGTHSYAWARRQQAPMDNGTCDISVVLTLVLLPGEADRIHMDVKEYAEFRCAGFVSKHALGFENAPQLMQSNVCRCLNNCR